MIRHDTPQDADQLISIWLTASINAHHFIDASYWYSQADNMRQRYLPSAKNFVLENDQTIIGFYSLVKDHLAALFIDERYQGQGFGTQLIQHAKKQTPRLTLSVYKANQSACHFYQKQGFTILNEQMDHHTRQPEYWMTTL